MCPLSWCAFVSSWHFPFFSSLPGRETRALVVSTLKPSSPTSVETTERAGTWRRRRLFFA